MTTGRANFEEALNADIEAMQADTPAELQRRAFESIRRGLDASQRLTKAEECKLEANSNFAQKAWLTSLAGYLAGIWFVQRGDPPCPQLVASGSEGFDEIPAALGTGTPGPTDHPVEKDLEERMEAVRGALHLNLAAAALKLSKWEIARTASQYVLLVQGDTASPKALFRLARAHEGEGDLKAAIAALEQLVAKDAGNTEAVALLETLRKRDGLERMTGKEFFTLSSEEQARMVEEINRGLEQEERSAGDEFDTGALAAALHTAPGAVSPEWRVLP